MGKATIISTFDDSLLVGLSSSLAIELDAAMGLAEQQISSLPPSSSSYGVLASLDFLFLEELNNSFTSNFITANTKIARLIRKAMSIKENTKKKSLTLVEIGLRLAFIKVTTWSSLVKARALIYQRALIDFCSLSDKIGKRLNTFFLGIFHDVEKPHRYVGPSNHG